MIRVWLWDTSSNKDIFINKLLVEEGYAERMEEPYQSKVKSLYIVKFSHTLLKNSENIIQKWLLLENKVLYGIYYVDTYLFLTLVFLLAPPHAGTAGTTECRHTGHGQYADTDQYQQQATGKPHCCRGLFKTQRTVEHCGPAEYLLPEDRLLSVW